MFFLDPKRAGSIPIKRLVTSSIMEELLELGMEGKEASTNWFSSENSLRVYSQYLEVRKLGGVNERTATKGNVTTHGYG